MEETKETAQNAKRFTYEQLEQIAGNLSNQVQQLNVQLQQANMFNTFKRLDYCFKVLEVYPTVATAMFSLDFVKKCAKEIEEIMTPPVNEPEDNSTKEKD